MSRSKKTRVDLTGKVMLWMAPDGHVEIAERRPTHPDPECWLPAFSFVTPEQAEDIRRRLCRKGYDPGVWIYSPRVAEGDPRVVAQDISKAGPDGLRLARFCVDVASEAEQIARAAEVRS